MSPPSPELDGTRIEAIAQEVASLLRAGDVVFHRGDPLVYSRRLARLNTALTLPIVPAERLHSAVLAKVLYAAWNLVVDDELDRMRTTRSLDSAIVFLLDGRGAERGATTLLTRLAELTPGGSIRRQDPLGIDLWEVVQGLNFECFINHSPALGTPMEYRRYSTMTASLKVLLDVDCLFASEVPEPAVYRALREVYDELTCAVKLAGDVGTLRREVHEEDNVNLLRILALPTEDGIAGGRPPEDVLASAMRFKEQVCSWSRGHMRRAVEVSDQLGSPDVRRVLATVERIVETYLSGVDPFFG